MKRTCVRACVRSDRVTAQRQTNELRGGRARISGINRPCQKPFHAKFSTIRQIMVIPDIMESTDPMIPATGYRDSVCQCLFRR